MTSKLLSDKWKDRIGQMTVAELVGIGHLAAEINAKAYVTIGCGAGADITSVALHHKQIPTLAFDWAPISPEANHSLVEFHQEDLFTKKVVHPLPHYTYDPSYTFTPKVHQIIKDFIDKMYNPTPILYYTDNGKKLAEMGELLRYLRPLDLLGCHDYGTEVPEKECYFLYDNGLELYAPYESWVKKHGCWQRFWIKK
jgi:hypothetical protein